MRNGVAYEHPTPVLPISGTGSSSSRGLLPTPSAGNFNDGEDLESWEARRQRNLAKGINGNDQGTPLAIAVQQLLQPPDPADLQGGGLLPTPSARDWKSGQSNIMDRNARPLNEVVVNSLGLRPD
jgi:hypothetical protein